MRWHRGKPLIDPRHNRRDTRFHGLPVRDVDAIQLGAERAGQALDVLTSWSETGGPVWWSAGSKRAATRPSPVLALAHHSLLQNPEAARKALIAANFADGVKLMLDEPKLVMLNVLAYQGAPATWPRAAVTALRSDRNLRAHPPQPTFQLTLRIGDTEDEVPTAISLQVLHPRTTRGTARIRLTAFIGTIPGMIGLLDTAQRLIDSPAQLATLRDKGRRSFKPWRLSDYAGAPSQSVDGRVQYTDKQAQAPGQVTRVRSWAVPALPPAKTYKILKRQL